MTSEDLLVDAESRHDRPGPSYRVPEHISRDADNLPCLTCENRPGCDTECRRFQDYVASDPAYRWLQKHRAKKAAAKKAKKAAG